METENIMSKIVTSSCKDEEEDCSPLPGFRFHPTDEELVWFYLKRKVEKRPISIELIKQIDIYKYDPWDLPRGSNVGEREWYFFCKRGRKYRNSIRPNRVTGSGFWKATGIDKPIYSNNNGEGRECIGLKKSLVYYRGSAGKGTKTDWMMHEFRLPADHDLKPNSHINANTILQEAEVWTLCRILKRNVSHIKKCIPEWKEISTKRNHQVTTTSSKTNFESDYCNDEASTQVNYISFSNSGNTHVTWQNHDKINLPLSTNHQRKPLITSSYQHGNSTNYQAFNGHISSVVPQHHDQTPSDLPYTSSFMSRTPDVNEFSNHQESDYWDELKSVVDLASNNPFIF
ncbi:hypothetical protein LIER_03995 [Lithospermum erythrorhizon]|uniref:NAC domain-containing protein n=1 Tax=Lithospermum erythrorhizon TaxID=34254 RepID=A0AAV3NZ95_LITER